MLYAQRRAYKIRFWRDAEDFLTQLAGAAGKLLRGGEPDLNTVAKMVPLKATVPMLKLPVWLNRSAFALKFLPAARVGGFVRQPLPSQQNHPCSMGMTSMISPCWDPPAQQSTAQLRC